MALFQTRLFVRIISKNRQVYGLKILTLAITFTCATLVTLFSINELGYDLFHNEANSIFRILKKNNSEEWRGNRLSNQIDKEEFALIRSDHPDHITFFRSKVMDDVNIIVEKSVFRSQKIHAVDPEILDVFSFEILNGDVDKFRSETRNILLSSSAAINYFGSEDVSGHQIEFYSLGDTIELTVAAVFHDFPRNSHERFDVFTPFEPALINTLKFNADQSGVYGKKQSGNLFDLQQSINGNISSTHHSYELQSLPGIYFGPKVLGEDTRHGDLYSILILITIAVLMLVLALTSYINLTTLTLPNRAKELAVKKLVGNSQFKLLLTLAAESLSVTIASMAIGIWLLFMLAGWIEPILSIDVAELFRSADLSLIATLLSLVLIVGLSPLLMAKKFTKATPNRLLSSETITFPRFKKVIIFLQLGISMFLIVSSMVIKRQIDYSLIKEPGQNHDQIVYMSYPKNLTNEELWNLRLNWKKQNPNIVDLMATSQLPYRITSKCVNSEFYFMSVDPSFQEFFNLEIKEGRWFMANDGDSILVVNEKGKELLGSDHTNVIGVVEDIRGKFHLPEIPVKINTAAYYNYNFLCIRILEVDIRKTVDYLSRHFAEDGRTANISFMDKRFEGWLQYQDRLNALSQILTIISVLLSCLAIYGLSVSLIRDKLKQIAIRKTCGASTFNITHLLVKEFALQMLVAIVFFAPVTYIFLKELLRNFVYSTSLNWLDPVFPLTYCAVIIIVLCGVQALSLNRTDLSSALKG